MHRIHGGLADAPGWLIDDAGQPHLVRWIGDHAQIGQHVFDLGPVKEPCASDDTVGNAVFLESKFQLIGLGVHAVENRMIPEVLAAGHRRQDLPGHVLCLVSLVLRHVQLRFVSEFLVRPEILAFPSGIVGDYGVGRRQNMPSGTIVLFQTDGPCIPEVVFKTQDVLDGGAAETVDALIVVPHYTDVVPSPRQKSGELVLQIVCILVFIDQHIPELALVEFAYFRLFLHQPNCEKDQVVEVHRVGVLHATLILSIDSSVHASARIAALFRCSDVFLRADHGVLAAADLAQYGSRPVGLLVQVCFFQDAFDQGGGIRRVVNGKTAVVAQPVDVPAQDPRAGRMEGHGPDISCLRSQLAFQSVLQLVGCLVGERDGDDAPWLAGIQHAQAVRPVAVFLSWILSIGFEKSAVFLCHALRYLVRVRSAAVTDQILDPVDQHGGLSAAGAGQQQQGALRSEHSLDLPVIQPGKPGSDHAVPDLRKLG